MPAEDDGRDVQDVDDAGEGDAERAGGGVDGGAGGRVPGAYPRGELARCGIQREPRGGQQRVPAGVLLEAAGRAAAAGRPVGIDADVPHLAGPSGAAGHHLAAQDRGASDADLTREVEEVAVRAWAAGCGLGDGARGQVGLVAEVGLQPVRQPTGEQSGRAQVRPAQVRGAQEDAGGDVDDAREGESGADEAQVRREAREDVGGQGAQPAERQRGVAADEIAVLHPLGDHAAAQVEHPRGQQPGVHLHPERADPGPGDERGGRPPGPGRPVRSVSSSSPAVTSSSASRVAVARVIPVAVATSARLTGSGAAQTVRRVSPRLAARSVDWRAPVAATAPNGTP